jgi:hypothetical protein
MRTVGSLSELISDQLEPFAMPELDCNQQLGAALGGLQEKRFSCSPALTLVRPESILSSKKDREFYVWVCGCSKPSQKISKPSHPPAAQTT